MSRFLDALRSRPVLLMDGAMGTQLLQAGALPHECLELWNLTHPDTVLAIHRAYVKAGAQVLLTNTFQSFPSHLKKFGCAECLAEIISRAVQLARNAIGPDGLVLGTLGPAPITRDELEKMLPYFQGVDGLLVETASTMDLAGMIVELLPGLGPDQLPVLFSATFLDDGQVLRTWEGLTPREIARQAEDMGVAALGVNCGRVIGLDKIEQILKEFRDATSLPLFARPNAGTPMSTDSSGGYPLDAKQLSNGMKGILNAGAAMIGGCCGTTPEHIAALREMLTREERGLSPSCRDDAPPG